MSSLAPDNCALQACGSERARSTRSWNLAWSTLHLISRSDGAPCRAVASRIEAAAGAHQQGGLCESRHLEGQALYWRVGAGVRHDRHHPHSKRSCVSRLCTQLAPDASESPS